MIDTVDSAVSALDAVQDLREALNGVRETLLLKRDSDPEDNLSYMLMRVIDQHIEKLEGVERWLDEVNETERLIG